ncbi:uncharacterized protein LOC123444988 [Hordeum vulgare subsp. vulgare]|uniref:E3 ubiquitin-protein ligase RMA n=1 Tax=Hordeum vulgare subsp. vulgare TaxID=112509 RepID=A0A8I6XR24_HORVV|nr:uncharacterized protein LOC123444988 [Hordeum vulgare subsp. vulgare]
MDADEAAGSSRRVDLNLYLGLPRAPRSRRSDLGSDLALSTPMPSSPSSSAASVDAPPPPEPPRAPYSPSRADLSPPPPELYSSYLPEDARLPYAPAPVMDELTDDNGFVFRMAPAPVMHETGNDNGFVWRSPVRASEFLGWEDRPSSSTASSSFLPDAATRYRRLLEQTGSRWLRSRRFRSDLPPLSSEVQPLGHDAAVPVPHHEPAIDIVGDNKVTGNGVEVGAPEKSEERGKSVATFACNICFEMAGEPVVTSCGHLFCWPCLYQWLNVYSNHKECPVCKGEVTEANITPIYGSRGNSCSDAEKAVEEGKQTGLTIPPRPHGNRLESFRQQFQHLRPMSRRLGDPHGILSSWRRLLDQQIMSSVSRFEGPSEPAVHETGDIAPHTGRLSRLATRMRARRLLSEVDNSPDGGFMAPDNGLPGNSAPDVPRHGSSPVLPEGFDLLQRLTLIGIANTERLATAMSDLRRIATPGQYGASASLSNPVNPEATVDGTRVGAAPSTDQASNSSTIAVIQGDVSVSETVGEPSNAGSSRSLRRGRSNGLASLDVDGGPPQRNKRRRM